MARSDTRKPEAAPNAREARANSVYRTRAWRRSPRSTLISARRYSVFVAFMRSALPIAAVALGVAVLSYALQARDPNRMALTFENLDRVENDLTMLKPRLSGTDDEGLPFTVTASSAVQQARGSDIVRLADVVADISLKDGNMLHMTAPVGVVDTKKHLLDVSGGIHLNSANGYDARTQAASADLKAGSMHGETRIDASGAFGDLSADRFVLNRDTKLFRFMGHVHTLLKHAGSAKPATSAKFARLRRTEK
jgi:lipopolysaccharide export system protein LptC